MLKENCLLLKLYRKLRKMFLSPRWESNLQPSDLRWDTLTIIETAVLAVRVSRLRTSTHCGLLSAIWVLVVQWLEHLTRDQKVAGSIPVWGSETFFWVCDKARVANSFPLIYQAASHLHIYESCCYCDWCSIVLTSKWNFKPTFLGYDCLVSLREELCYIFSVNRVMLCIDLYLQYCSEII